jgi:hypothetical protein
MYFITMKYPRVFIDLICDACEITEADYCVFIDQDGEMTLCLIQKENFFRKNLDRLEFTIKKDDLTQSFYIGRDYANESDNNIVRKAGSNFRWSNIGITAICIWRRIM